MISLTKFFYWIQYILWNHFDIFKEMLLMWIAWWFSWTFLYVPKRNVGYIYLPISQYCNEWVIKMIILLGFNNIRIHETVFEYFIIISKIYVHWFLVNFQLCCSYVSKNNILLFKLLIIYIALQCMNVCFYEYVQYIYFSFCSYWFLLNIFW